jgi:hypothetical protein
MPIGYQPFREDRIVIMIGHGYGTVAHKLPQNLFREERPHPGVVGVAEAVDGQTALLVVYSAVPSHHDLLTILLASVYFDKGQRSVRMDGSDRILLIPYPIKK